MTNHLVFIKYYRKMAEGGHHVTINEFLVKRSSGKEISRKLLSTFEYKNAKDYRRKITIERIIWLKDHDRSIEFETARSDEIFESNVLYVNPNATYSIELEQYSKINYSNYWTFMGNNWGTLAHCMNLIKMNTKFTLVVGNIAESMIMDDYMKIMLLLKYGS